MTKTDLRRHYRTARRAYVASLDKAAREAQEQALASQVAPLLPGISMAGSYAAVGDEIDPMWIEKRLGVHAFPRVAGPDISFHIANWAEMKPGFQGIPEPAATAPRAQPDLLLVPLIAVTLAGVRLGQGRGYYDRALAKLRAGNPKLLAIGLAWECQIAPTLPADRWDMPLDMVATPVRLVDCRKSR
ncbi:5-formyltetrahydrofolate cyclo-ligase [Sandarakinorhabdus sp.]|uniref:5-formyltetrahydrofolate cyclo-ligase n=1 Tax=Sandarakinorhabdus sp. TaxID=1916663 RepID=UPI003F70710F